MSSFASAKAPARTAARDADARRSDAYRQPDTPGPETAVRALQHAAGNDAVTRLLTSGPSGPAQPVAFKRAHEVAADALEREADVAAERALSAPEVASSRSVAIRRRAVGRRVLSPPPGAGRVPASLEGRGAPLPPSLRAELEPRLGADFSEVRVHTDPEAAEAAHALDAIAFTTGRHLVFGRGAYDPFGRSGKRLIAHELAHTVQQGASPPLSGATHGVRPESSQAPTVQRQADPAPSGGVLASLVEKVSRGLAEVLREGPVSWVGRKLKAAVQTAVGGLISGLGLGDAVTAFRGAFDRALALLARLQKGGSDACAAFKEILETLHDLGAAIAESEAVRQISAAVSTINDGLEKLIKLVVGGTLDELKPLLAGAWSLISGAASTVWGWIKSAKELLGSAWDWVVERLGLGGADSQDGVWAWIKRHAARAWEGIKQTLAPVAGPLTTAGKVLFVLSPFGPVYVLITYGPEVVKVVAFLWSHRNDPNIVRTAHKEMSDTFLPGLLDGSGNLRQKLGEAADWLLEKLGSLASAALALAGSISGLPLLEAAKGFAQRLAEDVRSFFSWGQEKLRDGVQWLTGAAKKLWSIIEPYKEVLGSIALAIAVPPTIPLILAGWAWRKIPRCYKAPIIDFILDIVLGALAALSALATFGPLWELLKPAILAFLRKLKQAQDWVKEKVSDRVAKILSGASLEFLLGFAKGFLQGIWEGLTDPFKAIATVIDALNWIKDLLAGLAARALGLTPPPPTPKITTIIEGEPEQEKPKEPSAAESRPLFNDEPAPAEGTLPAPRDGAAQASGADQGAGLPSAAAAPSASAPAAAPSASAPAAAPEAPSAASGTPEPATDHAAPTSPTPETESATSAAPAASAPATTGGAPGGSTLAGPGSAQTSDVPHAASAGGGAAAQPEQAAPPAAPASAKAFVTPGQAATPASPPPVPNPVGPQPDIAEVARQAISDIEPDVDKAATGFWPAIKEYFSSGPATSFDDLLAKLGEAWDAIKAKIAAAGTELAKKVTGFFASDQAEEETGHATGWLGGTITFQVLLDALTAGTWTGIMGVLQSIAKFINWPMEVMGEAFKLLSKLGAYLLDGLKALAKVIKEAGGGAIRAVMDAVGSIARKFVGIAEDLLGRFGRKAARGGSELAERQGERIAARELQSGAVRGAERMTEEEAARFATRASEREAGQAAQAAEREAGAARGAEREAGAAHGAEREAGAARGAEREGEQAGGREAAEQAGSEAAQHELALEAARAIEAPMAAARAPLPAILGALNALKVRFRWIKYFDAEPEAGGFEIYMIASKKKVGFVSTQTWDTGANAARLRKDMESAGERFGKNENAHHIVQSTQPRSARARDILDYHGVDINEASNGVRLAGTAHHGQGLHSYAAQDYITFRLEQIGTGGAKRPDQIKLILGDIADEIESGAFQKFMVQARAARPKGFKLPTM